jgi:hypothetical protein
MKTRLLLPVIVATATAFGASNSAQSEPTDAQAQASALLNRPLVSAPTKAREHRYTRSSTATDVHASAAALLSGRTSGPGASDSDHVASATKSLDAQAHAATLLRGSGTPVEGASRSTQVSKPLEAHPAVRVARSWSTRGIDPNAFIVGHPAGVQLPAASSAQSPGTAASVAGVEAAKLSAKLAK